MAEVGVLDQIDNDAGVAPLTPTPVETVTNPFEVDSATDFAPDPSIYGGGEDLSSSLVNDIVPIDTGAQPTEPSVAADSALPLEQLGEDQLVSGNLEKILSEGGVLMDVARSAGDEYAQSRGALGSSMGAEASMRAMIDTALPIAQQDAQSQLSQLQFNKTAEIQQVRDSILQSYQLQMENLSTNNKAQLIDLEQRYSAAIQSDANASEVYRSTMDSIAQLMSNENLSIDQQTAGMNELIGMLDAYLDFNVNLNSVNSVTGAPAESSRVVDDRSTILDRQKDEQEALASIKITEYNEKVADLGSREEYIENYLNDNGITGISRVISGPVDGGKEWDEAKLALDAEYQRWTRAQ